MTGRLLHRSGHDVRVAAAVLALALAGGVADSVSADPSPTGRTPKIFWTPERQAIWNRMRTENHPWWQQIKSNAGLSGTANARYADLGQWATMAYQVTGDPAYVAKAWAEASPLLKGTTPPDSSRNFTRAYFIEFVWMYDWLSPGLSAAQRTQWIDSLNYWADLCLGNTSVIWGTRLGDSDETTGHYFGIALWDLASAGDNPRAGTFLSRSDVGGLDQTSTSRNTMRNAVADYVRRAKGGVWIEGTKYNMGTLQLLLMGADGVKTATGVEHFPELTEFRRDAALAQMHEVTPNLSKAFQWGDNEQPRDLNRDRRVSLLTMLGGLLQDDPSIGPHANKFRAAIQGSEEPGFRWMIFGNPYAATADFRLGLANGHYAPGMGIMLARDGWASSRSLFASHMAPRTTVDHSTQYLGTFELYRAGEYAITHVIGYDANEAEHHNSMLLAGLSVMQEARGPIAQEFDPHGAYAYHVGATGGNRYTKGYYNPPPRFVHEWTRSVLYLPSTDQLSDTIIAFDRVNTEDPKTLVKLDRYTSTDLSRINGAPALKQWIMHTPVVPTLTSNAISWQTAGGQLVRVTTLLPPAQDRTVYDEDLLGLKGTISSSEKKYQVRIAPATGQRWDVFLNVVQAYSGSLSLTNTLVSSANNAAKGVLVKRPGHNNVLALFNATQGPDLPASKVVNGYLETDSTLLSSGYQVVWASDTSTTTVYLMDVNPAKQWFAAVDGLQEVPLAVSSEGVAQVSVSGAGSHLLQVRAFGDAADTTAPTISNIQVSSLSANQALVTWTTNEAATEQVEYGLTTAYGTLIPLASSLSTSHQVLLSSLAADTSYSYRVKSADAAGNLAVSANGSFRTLAASISSTSTSTINQPPVLNPVGAQQVAENQLLSVTLSASDPDGNALTYSASVLPTGATFSGATFTWTPTYDQAGAYSVTFSVSDGQLTDSEVVSITVTDTNRPPMVNAGLDQTMTLPASATLNGTVTDPDLPATPLTSTWSMVSGPGVVTFGNASAIDTTATFSAAGTYVLRLTASDGALSASDDVSVVVQAPGSSTGLIRDIDVKNGKAYEKGTLTVGERVYIDRSYTFTSIPAKYIGQAYIRTANDDKYVNEPGFLAFTLTAKATVYVAFDVRSTQIPSWLDKKSWVRTGQQINTTDVPHQLYKKSFPAGSVTLGSNNMPWQQGAQSNYSVIVVPE